MNEFKEYLRWIDGAKLILSGVLVWWIYTNAGWSVAVLAILVCIDYLTTGILDRMKYQKDMLLLEMVTRVAESRR